MGKSKVSIVLERLLSSKIATNSPSNTNQVQPGQLPDGSWNGKCCVNLEPTSYTYYLSCKSFQGDCPVVKYVYGSPQQGPIKTPIPKNATFCNEPNPYPGVPQNF